MNGVTNNDQPCPQCGERGIALGSVVDAESTQGTFQGSGAGVGVGTAGLSVVALGVGGTTTSRSKRADELARPAAPSFNVLFVAGPLLLLVFAAVAMLVSSSTLQVGNSMSSMPWAPGIDSFISITPYVVAVFVVTGVIGYAILLPKRIESETDRLNFAVNQDSQRQAIYHRLRYCATDNAVYDPKGGEPVVARKDQISLLISRRQQAAEDEGRPYGHPLEHAHNLSNPAE